MGYSDYTKEQLVEEVRALQLRLSALEQAHEVLQQKERRYGHLMETMSDGVVIEDKMNRIVYVNASFCETLGFSQEALVGRPTTDIIHPEGMELYLEQTSRRPCEHKASYEQKMRGSNGRVIPMIVSVRALQNENGDYDGCLTVITDITERKLAEEQLKQSEHKYRNLVENSQAGVYRTTLDGDRFLEANKKFADFFEMSREELLASSPKIMWVDPQEREKLVQLIQENGVLSDYEINVFSKSGEHKTAVASITLNRDEGYLEGMAIDITDRKQAEEALRRSEEEFRNLFDNAQAGVYRTTLDGSRYLMANQTLADMFGRSKEEMLNCSPVDTWADPADREEMIRRIKTEKVLRDFEIRAVTEEGEIITTLATVKLYEEEGYMEGVSVDITERKRIEEALRESEDKYRMVVENSQASVYILDRKGCFLFMNGMTASNLGGEPSEFIGRRLRELYPAELARLRMKHVAEVFRTQEKAFIEYQAEIKGKHHWFQTRLQPLQDARGEIHAVLGITHDITERKQGELRLRESEERYRTLVEGTGFPIFLLDRQGKFLYMNWIAAAGLGGYSKDYIGKSLKEVFPKPMADYQMRVAEKVFKRGEGMEVESISSMQEEKRWFHTSINPVMNAEGKVESVIGIAVDITEQKKAQAVLQRDRDELEQIVAERTKDLLEANLRLQSEIADKEQAEIALRESEATARALLNAPTDAVMLLDTDGTILEANETLARRFNKQVSDVIGMKSYEMAGKLHSRREEAIGIVNQTGSPYRFEDERQGFWNDNVLYPILDVAGQVAKIAVVSRDITELKQQEEELRWHREHLEELVAERTAELRQSEEKYRHVVNNTHDIIYTMSPEGILTFISPQALKMGFTEDEIVGHHISEFIHPDDIESVMKDLTYTMETGAAPVTEFRMRQKDGSYIYGEEIGEVVYEAGQIKQVVGSIRDITDRKQAEEILRESEQRFRAAANCASDLIYEDNDATGQIEWFGDIDGILGEQSGEGLSTSQAWQNRLHPEDRDRVINEIKKHAHMGDVYNVEYRIRHQDGSYRYWVDRGTIFQTESNPRKTVGACADITEQKEADERLRNSEQRFRMVFDHVTDGILLVDAETKKIFTGNPMMCRLLGYRLEELTELYFMDIHPLKDISEVTTIFNEGVLQGHSQAPGVNVKRKDGGVFFVDINATLITLEGRRYMMGVFRDITERLEAQAQLQQYRERMVRTERLASLGTIGANLMHQLNQPFTVIRLMLEDSQAELSKLNIPGRVRSNLSDGLSAISNAEDIVKHIREMTPRTGIHEEEIDLQKISYQVTQIFSDSARRAKLQLVLEGFDKAPKNTGDPSDLEQIFFNLIENAIHAANDRVEQQLRIQAVMREQTLELEFSDTCGGIDPKHQDKIFDAFFTTKAHGTGLGLAIIEQIVTERGGRIRMESQKGQGTTFFISLPWNL